MNNKDFRINAERSAKLHSIEFETKLEWMLSDVLDGSFSREEFDIEVDVLREAGKKAEKLISHSIKRLDEAEKITQMKINEVEK